MTGRSISVSLYLCHHINCIDEQKMLRKGGLGKTQAHQRMGDEPTQTHGPAP